MDVAGKRVTVMGLGRHGGGVAVSRWLAEAGAVVTVTDRADAAGLADSLRELDGLPIAAVHLGGHREDDFRTSEVIVVNPAVKPDDAFVKVARRSGAAITSEIELFLERCPAHPIGVTGSNGKSTTAAMLAAILEADGRRAWLGGNIGRSLLPDLHRMRATDWVVLELSSFQLAWLPDRDPLPRIVVVTSFSPNHLDWHGTLAHYAASKRRLLSGLRGDGVAVLDAADPAVRGLLEGLGKRADDGCRVVAPLPEEQLPQLPVPGTHNRRNASLAAAAADCAGCSRAAITRGLRSFAGLPHRLEPLGEVAGREFYNDSMATTPESAAAALETFSGRAWLLAGGHDKGSDMLPLGAAIAGHARGAAFYGAAREKLLSIARRKAPAAPLHAAERLDEALAWCFPRSRAGDAIVLSPACASYDQFRDYRHRGAHFAALVNGLRDRRNR
jgi:UDP-N-acetylmuramoylalanine--D-glutamate ligase